PAGVVDPGPDRPVHPRPRPLRRRRRLLWCAVTRPVASIRRTDLGTPASTPRAARHREIARRHIAAVAEARALVADLLPAPDPRRKYEDLDVLGRIVDESGRAPARAAWARAIAARNELVV